MGDLSPITYRGDPPPPPWRAPSRSVATATHTRRVPPNPTIYDPVACEHSMSDLEEDGAGPPLHFHPRQNFLLIFHRLLEPQPQAQAGYLRRVDVRGGQDLLLSQDLA